MGNQLFVNPYNFIPFGSKIEEKRTPRETVYRGKESLVSGWLTVELDTGTPLIIPDGAHPRYRDCGTGKLVENPDEERKKKLHKEYSFMRIPCKNGKQPVIPGSELRGMLRSVYETATDSCVAFLLDDKFISQRVPTFGSLQKRGLLAYEKTDTDSESRRWVLYSACAEKVAVNVEKDGLRYKNGKPVKEKNGDYIEGHGWLQYNIPVRNKNYHIAYLKTNKKVYTWDLENDEPYISLMTALDRQSKSRGSKSKNKVPGKNLVDALEQAKKGNDNIVPVYYFTLRRGEETLVYLSNSSIGRIAQRRKWKDIMGSYAPCEDTDKLCPACLLFGTVQGKGLKGHVRMTDAVPVGELKSEKHTLQILGEPRTSAFEFYLRKPREESATYWNFDFYGKKVQDSNGKSHTEYYDLGKTTVRGRKMYWHHPIAPDAERSHMNATMEAMSGGFVFRIYFDEITKEQLQNLIWVITLGENYKDSTKQHKLGHARPLGYGSVKLVVREQVIREIAAEESGIEVRLNTTEGDRLEVRPGQALEEDMIKNLLRMCDTQAISENIPVIYPLEKDTKGNEFIYYWFAQNRKNSKYLQTLPEPGDERLTLKGSWNNPGGESKPLSNAKNFVEKGKSRNKSM